MITPVRILIASDRDFDLFALIVFDHDHESSESAKKYFNQLKLGANSLRQDRVTHLLRKKFERKYFGQQSEG